MRIWHWLVCVMLAATVLGIMREEVGRVALVVFVTGLGEVFMGVTALLTLFRTVAAIGYAETLPSYAVAVAQTALVLVVASAVMCGWLWLGMSVLQAVVR